ncbi:MAG TPA: ABC transporter ATP-binding protein [Euzebyales bacterium]|nr:ABC transporter ATP-binding protein [Euzebyales bacterium]
MLEIDRVTVRFGGIVALDGASLRVSRGQICGLIGPNGAGKTTLFNCITRLYTPASGRMVYDGRDLDGVAPSEVIGLGIARTFQNLGLFPTMTVRDNVLVGAHHRTRASFVTAPLRLPGVRREEARVGDEVDELLERLDLRAVAGRPAQGLPLGTLKRVELARALAGRPALLLLDEPANGLNHAEVRRLEELIRWVREQFDLTILVVEHHMAFVMSISDTVVCLNFGRDIATGTPDDVRRNPAVIAAYLGPDA